MDYNSLSHSKVFLNPDGMPMAACKDGRSAYWVISFEYPEILKGYHVSLGAALGLVVQAWEDHKIDWTELCSALKELALHLVKHGEMEERHEYERVVRMSTALAEHPNQVPRLREVVRHFPFRRAPSWRNMVLHGGKLSLADWARQFDENDAINFVGAQQVLTLCKNGPPIFDESQFCADVRTPDPEEEMCPMWE